MKTTPGASLRDSIARVSDAIAEACSRYGRRREEVRLIAITKTQPAERVIEAAGLGLRFFGENRVQEAAEKIALVAARSTASIEWHLVGTLQRNKVKTALGLFAILQSVDSFRLAEAISRRAAGHTVPILLEVYLGDDPSRPGFRPPELREQIGPVMALPALEPRGLMTVAPLGLSEKQARQSFRMLRELRDTLVDEHGGLHLPELSMGMTDDYPLAIAEGATMVRIGRAIFGDRQ